MHCHCLVLVRLCKPLQLGTALLQLGTAPEQLHSSRITAHNGTTSCNDECNKAISAHIMTHEQRRHLHLHLYIYNRPRHL